MKLRNYQHAEKYEVVEWLTNELNLTPYQKEKLYENRLNRFKFMKTRKVTSNFLWRITLPFYLICILLLIISLPFKFVIDGEWGYSYNSIKWHDIWSQKIGL